MLSSRIRRPFGVHLISEGLEAEPGAVVGGGLLGVAHPPLHVVELEEPPAVGLGALVLVGGADRSLRHPELWTSGQIVRMVPGPGPPSLILQPSRHGSDVRRCFNWKVQE